jgi:glucuronokinase
MIIEETSYARAGLVGNPSDIFNGKTMSLLFDRFKVLVKVYETPMLTVKPSIRDITTFDSMDDLVGYRKLFGYYGGLRLIEAMIVRFRLYCDKAGIRLPDRNFTLEYTSSIPFGVGLGGSSAIIKAVFGALMRFYQLSEKDIPKPIQPNLLLEAETEELNISAGPQDRVVVVYGGLVYMDFGKAAYAENDGLHGHYEKLDPALLPPLFIAYKEELSKSSGAVHNIMRYRASVERDQKVLDVMQEKAALVDLVKAELCKHNKDALGPILTKDFDLRKSVYTISPEDLKMVEIARSLGTHAKQTGSGGAVIGIYRDEDQFLKLEEAYRRHRCSTIKVNVADYPPAGE